MKKRNFKYSTNMEIITINLPKNYIKFIKKMCEKKNIPSRSEFLRISLSEFLDGEIELNNKINEYIRKDV